MEIRTLRYFVELVQQGNGVRAAEALRITQPTLSRQLSALEDEMGSQLYNRGSHRIELTDAGLRLYQYAKAIVSLADEAIQEVPEEGEAIKGSVFVGVGETIGFNLLAQVAKRLTDEHPDIRIHITSGNSIDLNGVMEKELIDFFVESQSIERAGFERLYFPFSDVWGACMSLDDPLATHDVVRPSDLRGKSLLISRQTLKTGQIAEWMGEGFSECRIPATFSLSMDASMLASNGLGYAFTYLDLPLPEGMTIRPLDPPLLSDIALVWKRKRKLTKPCQLFLEEVKRACANW